MCYKNLRLSRCFFAIIIIIIVVLVINILVSKSNNQNIYANETCHMQTIVVKDGDTLWNLAEKYYTQDKYEIQKIIWEIQETNSLSSGEIYIGQVLYLPIL